MGEEERKEIISWSCWFRTLFAGSGALLLFIFTGIIEAQSAVMLPQLKKKDSFIQVTTEEETWIASLGIFTTPISAILCGPFIDTLGRKKGLLLFYFLGGAGFVVIAVSQEVFHIYIGRIISAFAVGLEVCSVVYLAEVTTEKQRSILFSGCSPTFAAGVTLTYIIGGNLPWNIASAVFGLGCFICFIVELFTPETPSWLFKMGRVEEAEHCLKRLGRSPAGIKLELETLQLSEKVCNETIELKTFLQPTVWKPFLLMTLFHFIECASGIYDLLYYTVDFVESLGTTYDPLTVSTIIATCRLVTNCTLGLYFTSVASRKQATMISGFGMGVFLLGSGTYEYVYRDTNVIERPYQWVPILFTILNVMSSGIGLLTLPWIMKAEVFPLQVRGIMTGAVFVSASLFIFISVKIYDVWIGTLKIYGYLFSLSVPSFFAVFFAIYMLPETQNKTLYEIEQSFLPKNRRQLHRTKISPEPETIAEVG